MTAVAERSDPSSLNGTGHPANVVQALAAVRSELPGIGKDQEMNDGGQRWRYRGIEDVTAVLGPLLGRHGVVFVPKLLSAEPHEFTVRSGAVWIEWRCLIAYTVYGPGGRDDSIEVGPVFALARDASDKGAQKAMTSAYKQVLNQMFCQPTGTMVRVPVDGAARKRGQRSLWTEVPIESLRTGDKVITWRANPAGLLTSGRVLTGITSRPYDGRLVTVTTGANVSRYTPEHRCIIRLGPLAEGNYVVYLMRRGDQYRVGRGTWIRDAPPSHTSPLYGLIERAAPQGADAVWVLSVHNTPQDAALHEALTAVRFGIPEVLFRDSPTRRAHKMDTEAFWMKLGTNRQQAEVCLASFGLLIEWPLLRRPVVGRSWLPLDGVAAANLRSGMTAAVVSESFDPTANRWPMRWETITVGSEFYSGLVHSLHVPGEHTYVADGIGTHNCIGDSNDDIDRANPQRDVHSAPAEPDADALARKDGWRDVADWHAHRDLLTTITDQLAVPSRDLLRVWRQERQIAWPPSAAQFEELFAEAGRLLEEQQATVAESAAERPAEAPAGDSPSEPVSEPPRAPAGPQSEGGTNLQRAQRARKALREAERVAKGLPPEEDDAEDKPVLCAGGCGSVVSQPGAICTTCEEPF